jgi:hypothetical protein
MLQESASVETTVFTAGVLLFSIALTLGCFAHRKLEERQGTVD